MQQCRQPFRPRTLSYMSKIRQIGRVAFTITLHFRLVLYSYCYLAFHFTRLLQLPTMKHLPDELILHIIACTWTSTLHPPPASPPNTHTQSSNPPNSSICKMSHANSSTSHVTTTSGNRSASLTPPPSAAAAASHPPQHPTPSTRASQN